MSGPLRLSGYASLFDQPDLSGDRVVRGAFSASILSLSDGCLPMLFGHDTASPLGVWDRIFEDKTGLYVSGRLIGGTLESDRISQLIQSGAVSGLSIGYRVRRFVKTAMGRCLTDLDLWEVSVVAFPMLRTARISQIDDLSLSQKGKMAYA